MKETELVRVYQAEYNKLERTSDAFVNRVQKQGLDQAKDAFVRVPNEVVIGENGKEQLQLDLRPVYEGGALRGTSPPTREDEKVLYAPIYKKEDVQNAGSGKEIIETEHIHTAQLHVPALTLAALGVLSGEIDIPHALERPFIERTAALLLGEASLAHFIVDANSNPVYPKVPGMPDRQFYVHTENKATYVLTSKSFYEVLSHGGIPTADVHDCVHHALQFRTWPEFFIPLFHIANLVQDEALRYKNQGPVPKDIVRLKALMSFATFVTAEYSIIGETPQSSASYGCLLYQYPRKSPIASADLRDGTVSARTYADWSMVRSLMSLYRRQLSAQTQLKDPTIDWFRACGYALPPAYQPEIIGKGIVREPVASLGLDHNIDFAAIRLPATAPELFLNVRSLLIQEFGANKAFSSKPLVEMVLHHMNI